MPRLINADTEDDTTSIYLGMFIFLSIAPLLTIDIIPWLVVSPKKFHNTIANSKDTAKNGMSAPNRKKWTNTTYITPNINNGFKADHATPRTEPSYLNLKSVFTNSFNNTHEYRYLSTSFFITTILSFYARSCYTISYENEE